MQPGPRPGRATNLDSYETGKLFAGGLKPGDARYDEIREPPKKANPLKTLVAVVTAAVVVYFTAGAATGWAATALGNTAGATTVSGVAATAIGSAVGSYAGAVISTGIQTGSLDKALTAGENSLKGSVAKIAVDMLASQLGLPTSGVGGFAVKAVGNAVTSVALSGGDFGQALLQGSINAGVEIVAKDAAHQIGAAKDTLGTFGVELAHAGVGCASAVARGGNSESCGAGATGAVVGHLAAGWVDSANSYTLSEEEVAFFGKTMGGVGAALVGSGDKVEQNFGIGQTTADNAVVNNYLTTRQLTIALENLDKCDVGCDVLKKSLQRNTQQGGEQATVDRVETLCRSNPQSCLGSVNEIAAGLKELQSPEVRTQLGDAATDVLIARQSSDLGKAVEALQWGADHLESSQAIVRAAVGVGLTAAGGGLALSLGRAVMAACGSGLASPACLSLSTELAVGAMETAGGVPTVGLTAASITATANQLAKTAATATDAAQVVKEVQLVRAEGAAGRTGVSRVTGVPDGVPYFRVEGGGSGSATSRNALTVNADGSVSIAPGCTGSICVSVGNSEHASYYLINKRPDGSVVVFEVDRSTHNRIMESAVDQFGSSGAGVKITDKSTPGTSIELNRAFAELMTGGSSNGRVLTQKEFANEFGGN